MVYATGGRNEHAMSGDGTFVGLHSVDAYDAHEHVDGRPADESRMPRRGPRLPRRPHGDQDLPIDTLRNPVTYRNDRPIFDQIIASIEAIRPNMALAHLHPRIPPAPTRLAQGWFSVPRQPVEFI